MHFLKAKRQTIFASHTWREGWPEKEKGVWLMGGVEIGAANRMEMVEERQSPFWPGIKAFLRVPGSKEPLKFHSRPQTFTENLP